MDTNESTVAKTVARRAANTKGEPQMYADARRLRRETSRFTRVREGLKFYWLVLPACRAVRFAKADSFVSIRGDF
jgi:hypothetical protein